MYTKQKTSNTFPLHNFNHIFFFKMYVVCIAVSCILIQKQILLVIELIVMEHHLLLKECLYRTQDGALILQDLEAS